MARSPELIELGIARLQERIEALQNFDIHPVAKAAMPELTALSAAIADTLDRCFMACTARQLWLGLQSSGGN
jgi:ABC-type transporter Mla maintaining outer membrane lipid asymmetry permease subunit MlaE